MRRILSLTLCLALGLTACSNASSGEPPATATSSTLAIARLDTAPPTTTTTWAPSANSCSDPGAWGLCEIEEFDNRPYDIFVPSSYDPEVSTPAVIALHGGGGKAESAITTTCAGGDRSDSSCLHNIAEREGFVVVYPNGSGFGLLPNLRTWNAGGGEDGYNCVSGQACEREIDDIAYFAALLDHLSTWLNVDTGRIYATGLSNGAAMAHRLACEMSDRFTAIAAVGGTNQFAVTGTCDISLAPAIMQIHGTEDPCWTYEASSDACADNSGGIKVGVAESTDAWVDYLHCDPTPVTSDIPDVAEDDTTTTRTVWSGCADGAVEVHLMTIEGGGHTWPGGDRYLTERIVGRVTHDWDSSLIWEFFSRFDRN